MTNLSRLRQLSNRLRQALEQLVEELNRKQTPAPAPARIPARVPVNKGFCRGFDIFKTQCRAYHTYNKFGQFHKLNRFSRFNLYDIFNRFILKKTGVSWSQVQVQVRINSRNQTNNLFIANKPLLGIKVNENLQSKDRGLSLLRSKFLEMYRESMAKNEFNEVQGIINNDLSKDYNDMIKQVDTAMGSVLEVDLNLCLNLFIPKETFLSSNVLQEIIMNLNVVITKIQSLIDDLKQLFDIGELPLKYSNNKLQVMFPNLTPNELESLLLEKSIMNYMKIVPMKEPETLSKSSSLNFGDILSDLSYQSSQFLSLILTGESRDSSIDSESIQSESIREPLRVTQLPIG